MDDPTPTLLALTESQNPDYDVHTVENVLPFRVAVEMIGNTAGRVYLREKNAVTAVTMSDTLMERLRDALTDALEGRNS